MQTCQLCGETNPPHARYCMACGNLLTPAARAEEIRRVTVLFADIAGSTALITGTHPEDARAFLAGVVRLLMTAVSQFGGSVVDVAGDGIKALFGAPIALEDHARRACLAALRMQANMMLVTTSAEGRLPAPVRIRVGIHTGNVLLTSVASHLHVAYSAEGETTHLAAKAQQAADPGSVLITVEVARLVQGFFETRAHPPLSVSGLAEPVPVCELLRPTDKQSRFQVAMDRGLTEFVGREDELAWLERAAARAEGGEFAVAGVAGEPGVGKSRLLWEFRSRLQARGWAVFAAHATLNGTAIAFHPVLSALRAMVQIETGDEAATLRRKLAAVAGPGVTLDLTPLLVLFDLPPDDALWDRLESRQRQERTRRALLAALLAACHRQPTALVIDDLHEADAETQGFVEQLLKRAGDTRLLLVLEYRPEQVFGFEQLPRFEVLRVEPLAAPLAVTLFRQLAGADASLSRLERQLVERVAGNPFFIEEGVRMLSESGVLSGSFGHYHMSAGPHALDVPGSVGDVVESRIARLAATEREVLQVAAVFGKQVSLAILRGLTGLGLDELAARLSRLVEAGLLVHASDPLTGEFAFKHAVTQEVAYRILKKTEQRAVHARVVALLESSPLESMPERVELLAQHALRAQEWERAVAYLQRAAQRAAKRSALHEAVRLLDQAVTAVPRLAPAQQPADREIDLRLAMRGPLVALGQMGRVGEEVQRLEALAPACVDLARQGRLAVFVCGHR
jgi:class 3 adenylate cyclase